MAHIVVPSGVRTVVKLLAIMMLVGTECVHAAEIVDATGLSISIPDRIQRVVPAGSPAAVLLLAIAPDLMAGWPSPVSDKARAMIAPGAGKLPQIPRLTGRENVSDKVLALRPDMIIDYGSATGRYAELAKTMQARTGIPTILLDGALDRIPATLRSLGMVLNRRERAEVLASLAEALLALPSKHAGQPRVFYARGADGLNAVVPGGDLSDVFKHLGWLTVAPGGDGGDHGPFRRTTIEAIRTLDPDVLIFADPAMRQNLTNDMSWKTLRAVREGRTMIAPSLPFGWIEEPPSINRLLGLAWLRGYDPVTLAVTFNAVFYGHVLTAEQRNALLEGMRSP